MTISEARQWLTSERMERINHDRERAGVKPVARELLAKVIAKFKGRDLVAMLSRYE